MSTINAASFSALKKGLRINYTDKNIRELIRHESPFLNFIDETSDFEKKEKKGGGRYFAWSLQMDRAMNANPGTEEGYLPGFSGATNDDMDRVTPEEVTLGRVTKYADASFTSQQMADAHKSFEQFKGWGFAKHIKGMQDDFRMNLEWDALSDGTGMLGVVVSAIESGGNTVVTLKAATEIDSRGILGTQRLYKNQKVAIVRAADWATNARLAKIDSNVSNVGTAYQKVLATSGIMDVSAAPTVTLSGDLTVAAGSGVIAAGDVIVQANSRPSAAGGGQSADDSDLRCFQGLFGWVDDGTLNSKYGDLTRSSYTQLNSQVDLSAVGRKLTWPRVQVMMDKLYRRRGSDDRKIEDEYIFFSERSVRTGYVADAGEAAKRYSQESKAKKLVSGFGDVTMCFVGSDTLMPWVALNTFPYGHAALIRKSGFEILWDIPPSIIDDDDNTMRMIEGTPKFYIGMQGVGQFRKLESWLDARFSGIEGVFSAAD
jgi:hypothetical protein